MEEKKLTPEESMELIASMIQESKQRIPTPNLKVSLMWAVLSIVTALAAWLLLTLTRNPWYNFVWFAIPVIGLPLSCLLSRQTRKKSHVKTYLDKVRDGVWSLVGYIAIGLTVACFIAQQCGYPQAWLAMFYYAFIIVGFAAAVNGLLLRENTYLAGGMISIFSGFAIIICNLCRVPLNYSWVAPLYILCFFLMFIVPAFVISRKAKAATK